METKNTTVYICEHCRKLYLKKYACIKHEKYCKKNPNNKHKCFEFCFYLKKIEVEDTNFDHNGYETGNYISHIEFHCTKTNTEMFSYIAERKGLRIIKYAKRMPLECENYDLGEPELQCEKQHVDGEILIDKATG